jgi:hypothetical protein
MHYLIKKDQAYGTVRPSGSLSHLAPNKVIDFNVNFIIFLFMEYLTMLTRAQIIGTTWNDRIISEY